MRASRTPAKATKCKPAHVAAKRSSSRARRRQRESPPKERSTTQRRGSSTTPFLASGSLTPSRGDAGLGRGRRARVALVDDVGQFDGRAGHVLPRPRERLDLSAFLGVGGPHSRARPTGGPAGRRRWGAWLPLRRLAPSSPARPPLCGVLGTVRPSRITALGRTPRPGAKRHRTRKACSLASNTPDRIPRWLGG